MLKRSRWLLLKRPEKLTGEQRGRLAELVRRNLRTVRAYLLKEDFQSLWGYVSPYWAGQFLDRWCTRTMRSRLDPMKEVARMVALAPRPDSELVPSPGAVLQWRCRRLQRKGQSDHQTGVWVPHLRGTGSRFVSRTWRPARTKTHPQILLTRPSSRRSPAGRGVHRDRGGARLRTVRPLPRANPVRGRNTCGDPEDSMTLHEVEVGVEVERDVVKYGTRRCMAAVTYRDEQGTHVHYLG